MVIVRNTPARGHAWITGKQKPVPCLLCLRSVIHSHAPSTTTWFPIHAFLLQKQKENKRRIISATLLASLFFPLLCKSEDL